MDAKLIRIRELINSKEKIDAELAELIEGIDKPRRAWTRRSKPEETSATVDH